MILDSYTPDRVICSPSLDPIVSATARSVSLKSAHPPCNLSHLCIVYLSAAAANSPATPEVFKLKENNTAPSTSSKNQSPKEDGGYNAC